MHFTSTRNFLQSFSFSALYDNVFGVAFTRRLQLGVPMVGTGTVRWNICHAYLICKFVSSVVLVQFRDFKVRLFQLCIKFKPFSGSVGFSKIYNIGRSRQTSSEQSQTFLRKNSQRIDVLIFSGDATISWSSYRVVKNQLYTKIGIRFCQLVRLVSVCLMKKCTDYAVEISCQIWIHLK